LDQNQEHARHLLERVGVLRHPCDLDLLVFFARHPRTLMTSEQLAGLMGNELAQIADSLERLLKADVIKRTHNPTRATRMYVLAADTNAAWLAPLLEFASTRHGRLAMRRVLALSTGKATDGSTAPADDTAAGAHGARPLLVKRKTDVAQK
jgi:DNA-binding MarR family transcriptional regulator